jgi:sulfur relay (sulfurtransferase) complex TusBCD TusD component (DsrE family)
VYLNETNKENKMFNILNKLKLVAILASLTLIGFTSNSVMADSSGDGAERVAISLNTDPTKDPEPACVALQIGMNLLMPIGGVAADEVTLFLTTGGVELVNPHNSIYNRTNPKLVCTTPDGVDTASLQGLLAGFQSMGGNVMICPLCAMSRGISEPTAGDMGSGPSIHNLFLNADKVITF